MDADFILAIAIGVVCIFCIYSYERQKRFARHMSEFVELVSETFKKQGECLQKYEDTMKKRVLSLYATSLMVLIDNIETIAICQDRDLTEEEQKELDAYAKKLEEIEKELDSVK